VHNKQKLITNKLHGIAIFMCRTERYWAFEIAQVEEEEVGLHTVTEGSPAVEEDVFVVSEDSAVLVWLRCLRWSLLKRHAVCAWWMTGR
jgi:hypothetical protein